MQLLNQKTLPSRTHPVNYKITNIADINPAPDTLIATTLAYVFRDDELLLSLHPQRGWGLPGGHRELGETIEQTIIREVLEETQVVIKEPRTIGYISTEMIGQKPDNYHYPYPIRYAQVFVAESGKVLPFMAVADAIDRQFVKLGKLDGLQFQFEDELLWLPFALKATKPYE